MIDLDAVAEKRGSTYPEPHASAMGDRSFRNLGDAAGLTQFGASLVRMPPGSRSSLRHWHTEEDEFAVILEGELTLVEDEGENRVVAGDFIGWPKNSGNGHCLVNDGAAEATFLVIGTRAARDECHYSDVDLIAKTENGVGRFVRRDGTEVK